MTRAIICIILCSHFASVHARINPPDFDSGWLTIQGADHVNLSLARKNISHGLGETPLLVDVQVKAIDGPNKGYVFQAVGHQIRDDDYNEGFGNVVYVYDSKSVIVSAPVRENGNQGKAIFIATSSSWVGPNEDYSSHSALFRVRAWKESSLPPADFVSKSHVLTAATVKDSYLELFHGFGDLPALVISRIQFPYTLNEYPNFYADSVGAGMIVYPKYNMAHAGYVVYGYNYNYIRVWAPTSTSPSTLFDGRDGSGIYVSLTSASLELFAWTLSSLTPDACNVLSSCTDEKPATIFSLTRAWAGPNDGANAGFIFPGSGSLAYRLQAEATPCTYGGLVYAYNNETIRFWRPGSAYGSVICIQNVFGHGTNSQASSDVRLFMFTWITDDNESSAGISPCNVNVVCTKIVGNFTGQCKSGYTENRQTYTAQSEGNKLVIFIAVPVSIVVLLVFVLTVTVLLLRRKPNQNEDGLQLTHQNTANATNDDDDYDVVDSFGDSYYNYRAVYRTDDYTTAQAGGGDPCYSHFDRNDTESAIHNNDSSNVNLLFTA